MRILFVGAPTNESIGYLVGERLRGEHEVLYASRSPQIKGAFVHACDATNHEQMLDLLNHTKPQIIVYAAGVFCSAQSLGSINEWGAIRAHLEAKTLGALVVADVAARIESTECLIFLSGREVSVESGFAAYTVGNGASWSLVQFAASHVAKPDVFYIDLPLVTGTTMAQRYLKGVPDADLHGAIGPEDIAVVLQSIFHNQYKSGSRIVLGTEWKI